MALRASTSPIFLKVQFWGKQSALRPWPLYPLVQSPWYHIYRKLRGHQSPYGHGSQEKYFSLNWISNVNSLAIQLHTVTILAEQIDSPQQSLIIRNVALNLSVYKGTVNLLHLTDCIIFPGEGTCVHQWTWRLYRQQLSCWATYALRGVRWSSLVPFLVIKKNS